MDPVLSRTISWLRFPLIFMVVAAHSPTLLDLPGFPSPVSHTIFLFIHYCTVSLMMFFSGLLLYKGKPIGLHAEFKASVGKVYMSRLLRVVWPMLLWGAIYQLAVIGHLPRPDELLSVFFSPDLHTQAAVDITGRKFGYMFCPSGCIHLWFLRELAVLTLLSPLIALACSKRPKASLIVICILYAGFFGINAPGFNPMAMFFFSLGIWCGVNHFNPLERIRCAPGKTALCLFAAFIGPAMFLYGRAPYDILCHHATRIAFQVCQICSTAAMLCLGCYLSAIPKWQWMGRLAKFSFIIYLTHVLALDFYPLVANWLTGIPADTATILGSGRGVVLAFVLCMAFDFVAVPMLYLLMEKYFPHLLALLTGGHKAFSQRVKKDINLTPAIQE